MAVLLSWGVAPPQNRGFHTLLVMVPTRPILFNISVTNVYVYVVARPITLYTMSFVIEAAMASFRPVLLYLEVIFTNKYTHTTLPCEVTRQI